MQSTVSAVPKDRAIAAYLGDGDVVCILKQADDDIATVAAEAPFWLANHRP